jgi:hypothetical protein
MKSPEATPRQGVKETDKECPGGNLEVHRCHAEAGTQASSGEPVGGRDHHQGACQLGAPLVKSLVEKASKWLSKIRPIFSQDVGVIARKVPES